MDFTSYQDLDHWIQELTVLRNAQSCAAPHFIKPFHLATLAHTLRKREISSLDLPEKISSYAHTMNLWGALGIQPPLGAVNRNKAGRYHPIELLSDVSTIDDTAYTLTQLFVPVCSDEHTNDAICTMMRELIDNCYSHSDVDDGVYGVICAQAWSGGKKAQIALVDTGVGIRTSLALNTEILERLATENSCELATEYGVTGKPGKGHSGYGLAVARKLIEQNGGVLVVRSGAEAFCLCANKVKVFHTQPAWDGTLVIIEWNLDVPMDISAVYESFPLPEGMTHDDFNFEN